MTLLNQIRRESASRLGMALAALLLFSIFGHAQPLHHWTWEGRTGTEGHPRPDGDWWEDKLGNVPMSFVSDGTVERVALPATGPGSAFPDPMPQTGGHNIFGVDTRIDGGYIRTGPTPAFNRDRFTVEVFFNPVTVAGTSERRFFDMSHSVQMGRGLVRNGVLAARIYTPDGGAANSVLQSNLSVVAGKDYYAAIGVSTGPNAADRFVDFYLKNLTDNGPLQYQRVSLDSRFTGTNHRVGGHSLRIGRDNAFHVIGDVRYSNGILAEADLLVSQPPMPPLVLEALGVDTESGG